jgi:hypothetical protein
MEFLSLNRGYVGKKTTKVVACGACDHFSIHFDDFLLTEWWFEVPSCHFLKFGGVKLKNGC